MITLEAIRRALEVHTPRRLSPPDEVGHRASVAMIFAGPPRALRLCFIHRAKRPDDRWSGQMAFPGGRATEDDDTPRDTAIRETQEEVGLDIEDAERLGELSHLSLRRRGLDVDGVVIPFAFYTGETVPPLVPNEEVAAAHWIRLGDLWDPANIGQLEFLVEGEMETFPGIRHGKQVIWGLTYRILTSFSRILGRPLPGPRSP
jgi:8-oxo-dGTP pyrophosphatase MutT (NUDIX family)